MANEFNDTDDTGTYASRHPRRMAAGMLMVGTALGAGLMAAKKEHDKNMLQKLLDQLGR